MGSGNRGRGDYGASHPEIFNATSCQKRMHADPKRIHYYLMSTDKDHAIIFWSIDYPCASSTTYWLRPLVGVNTKCPVSIPRARSAAGIPIVRWALVPPVAARVGRCVRVCRRPEIFVSSARMILRSSDSRAGNIICGW